MKGKPDKIDLFKFYAQVDQEQWNEFLCRCLKRRDLWTLERMYYGIQVGMSDLAKKKLNTEKFNVWYLRLQRSIERTMRDIIRLKNPNPLDDPKNKAQWGHYLSKKRLRDEEIEKYLRSVRF